MGLSWASPQCDTTVWTVYEQVLMASLDVGDLTFAKQCLAKLVKQFPDSARVKRASGMVMEFSGKYEEALAIYDEVLESSPTNVVVLKRKACVSKAQGDLLSTVNALNSLLQINAGDISSWIEMGEIYVSLCDCEAAAFCFEEIILLQPNCAQYHSRLAEIYYTNGQFDSLLKARSHYSMALNLQTVGSGNTRALYGLILTCRKLKPMIEDEKEKEYAVTCELLAWATERLQEVSSCMNSSCKHLGILGE